MMSLPGFKQVVFKNKKQVLKPLDFNSYVTDKKDKETLSS